jgi:hypothetical protein
MAGLLPLGGGGIQPPPPPTQVATPVFSLGSGTYSGSSVTFSISCVTPGVSIYVTNDGSAPSPTNGTLYTAPIVDSTLGTTLFKAAAFLGGYTPSAVASVEYTVVIGQTAAPTFLPAAGSYTGSQSVVPRSTTPGATIYYTLDGTTPIHP